MIGSQIKDILDLAKIRLSLATATSALLGSVLHGAADPDQLHPRILVFLAVFFLSSGAATLNNVQDQHFDSRLKRTGKRPLPTGRIHHRAALLQCVLLLSCGFTLLPSTPTHLPIVTAIITLFLYNGLYTPLKQKTSLAMIPGTFCGMLPPLIGWHSAGGTGINYTILLLMVIFGLWQLPHFWLLTLYHKSDYHEAHVPTMLSLFTERQLHHVLFCWVSAFAVLTLFLPLASYSGNTFVLWLLSANALLLVISFSILLFNSQNQRHQYRRLFVHLNISMAFVIAGGLWGSFIWF